MSTNKEKTTIASIVRMKLKSYKIGTTVSMNKIIEEVSNEVIRVNGAGYNCCSRTISRALRQERLDGGYSYQCIDRQNSIYRRVN